MKIGKYNVIDARKRQYEKAYGVFVITLYSEKKAPYSFYKTVRIIPRFITYPIYHLIGFIDKLINYIKTGDNISVRWHFLKGYFYYNKYPDFAPTLRWFLTGHKFKLKDFYYQNK